MIVVDGYMNFIIFSYLSPQNQLVNKENEEMYSEEDEEQKDEEIGEERSEMSDNRIKLQFPNNHQGIEQFEQKPQL